MGNCCANNSIKAKRDSSVYGPPCRRRDIRDRIEKEMTQFESEFKKYDQNSFGYISTKDFRVLLQGLDKSLSEIDLKEIVKIADSQGKGLIEQNFYMSVMKDIFCDSREVSQKQPSSKTFGSEQKCVICFQELVHCRE